MNLLVILATTGQLVLGQGAPAPAGDAAKPAAAAGDAAKPAADAAAAPAKQVTEADIEALAIPADYGDGVWFPPQASTFAESSDSLFYFILALCVFFFILLMWLTAQWAIQYKRKSKDQRTSPLKHSFKLEFLWSAIPTVLLVWMFAWGQHDYTKLAAPPNGALDVRVLARKWNWTFSYPSLQKECAPDQYSRSKFVVPLNRPVKLTISSSDVIHSLWVPAFRLKRDAVPNRYTGYWFEATRPGVYDLFCAEFCGQDHSIMKGKVHVLEDSAWEDWLASGDCPAVKDTDGEGLFRVKGCVGCHSIDGAKGTGPTMKGNYGKTLTHTDGTQVVVDDQYIRNSILKPNSEVVQGYAPQMPSFSGQLNETQINAIIDYMKTLK